jgi:hypothetical protein
LVPALEVEPELAVEIYWCDSYDYKFSESCYFYVLNVLLAEA